MNVVNVNDEGNRVVPAGGMTGNDSVNASNHKIVTQGTSLDEYDKITTIPAKRSVAVITTASTTTPHTGSGSIDGIYIAVTLVGTVTIYDDTTQIWSILPIGTPVGFIDMKNIGYSTSLKIVTSGADKITVAYLMD